MKILYLTPTLNPRSGWGRLTLATLEHVRALGFEVAVCSEDSGKDLPYPAFALMPLRSRFSFFALLLNTLRVRRLMKDFDVVHALDGWPFGVYAAGAVWGRKKGFVMSGVGTYSVAPLYAPGKRVLMRWAYRRVQKVFCISKYVMGELVRAGAPAKKLEVVHFGVQKFPVPTEAEKHAFKAAHRIADDAFPVVVTVGAIKDRKGQLDTLKAIALLKVKYPRILYLVAGSVSDKVYISHIEEFARTKGVEGHMRIIANANDTEIASLYTLASLSVLASTNDEQTHHFEGFGGVIIEAYQFGTPAVGSRDCGIEDAIVEGKSGMLSKQRDPEDIAKQIQTVVERRDFFSAGALEVAKDFSWVQTAKTYVEQYQRLVSN